MTKFLRLGCMAALVPSLMAPACPRIPIPRSVPKPPVVKPPGATSGGAGKTVLGGAGNVVDLGKLAGGDDRKK